MAESRIERLRRTQGCLTDCVAFLFGVHPEMVPYFVRPRKGWMSRLRAFFRRRGYDAQWRQRRAAPKRGTYIVCGDSQTYGHAVVYRNGRLVYDPDYPSKWRDDRVTHVLFVSRR